MKTEEKIMMMGSETRKEDVGQMMDLLADLKNIAHKLGVYNGPNHPYNYFLTDGGLVNKIRELEATLDSIYDMEENGVEPNACLTRGEIFDSVRESF